MFSKIQYNILYQCNKKCILSFLYSDTVTSHEPDYLISPGFKPCFKYFCNIKTTVVIFALVNIVENFQVP
jgi:hypothetical protein